MSGKTQHNVSRRKFVADVAIGSAAAITLFSAPTTLRAQPRTPSISLQRRRPARDRLEEALSRIADPNGEGKRACLTVYTNAARASADAADARARGGISLGPLDGAIVSIKDLFDVAGEPTRAGSKILVDAPPATADAPVVRRLRAAGSVIVAKTNMAEFAFSIFGLNPHYGTPGNPADRTRIPGGSSSGAAAIESTIAEIFGPGSHEYSQLKIAVRIDTAPWVMETEYFGRRSPGTPIAEIRQGLEEGCHRALALLQQAANSLKEGLQYSDSDEEVVPGPAPRDLSKVFVVHGHDGEVREAVARFISEKLNLQPVILHERPNKGRTIITKFREEAAGIAFAVVLMTPDDLGKASSAPDLNPRARQNVVFELGFFIGALGPERVAAIVKGDIENPSDFDGVVYISFDGEDWRTKLGQELQAAGYNIDWNRVMRS